MLCVSDKKEPGGHSGIALALTGEEKTMKRFKEQWRSLPERVGSAFHLTEGRCGVHGKLERLSSVLF